MIKTSELINERIYIRQLSSGLRCIVIPKAGYVEKQAMLGVRYGSADSEFTVAGKKHTPPLGIAHFLEHKMFEDEKNNVFERFADLNASANAFTNFQTTAYYFTCTENFYECLKLLLAFVQTPYFTEENVQKEKPIIAQEIEMYRDNPFWVMHFNLLEALYEQSPIRHNIAGSIESIHKIDSSTLYFCHKTFYRPENMVLCCVGEIDPDTVIAAAEQQIYPVTAAGIERGYGDEPPHAIRRYTEERMALARPMFQLGFKDNDFSIAFAERVSVSKILLDLLFGESSAFFEKMYSKGIVDGPFALEYVAGTFYGTAICTNSSADPRAAVDQVLGEIAYNHKAGLDENRFMRLKRKHLGRFIRGFDSVENLTQTQTELAIHGLDLLDVLDVYRQITFSQVCARFARVFHKDNHAVSVIMPSI